MVARKLLVPCVYFVCPQGEPRRLVQRQNIKTTTEQEGDLCKMSGVSERHDDNISCNGVHHYMCALDIS